ncbi:MAG: hypothetical protein K5987_01600 [Lachnospiraceae bacterium]|nr:hypothetical protein [Lachnospiraceae bacterium]
MKNKLMIQEIRETGKLILFIYTYIAVLSVATIITSQIAEKTHSSMADNLMVVFLLSAMMGGVAAGIVMAGRFYNLLFTDEGLIRLTLPVKNREHLQTNIKLGILILYLAVVLYSAIIGIMEYGNIFPVGEIYQELKEYYVTLIDDHAGLKALITILSVVLAFAGVIANYYITAIFALTVSRRIVSKYGIMQKRGVIFITGMVLFNIQLLALWGITYLVDFIEADLASYAFRSFRPVGRYTLLDYLRYSSESVWVKDCLYALIFFMVYGITAIVMYRICRNIMDRKLEV